MTALNHKSPFIALCAQVTAKPDTNKIIVFNKGTPIQVNI